MRIICRSVTDTVVTFRIAIILIKTFTFLLYLITQSPVIQCRMLATVVAYINFFIFRISIWHLLRIYFRFTIPVNFLFCCFGVYISTLYFLPYSFVMIMYLMSICNRSLLLPITLKDKLNYSFHYFIIIIIMVIIRRCIGWPEDARRMRTKTNS